MSITISSPEDRKKIKEAVQEISNSLTRIEAERDLIREIIKEVSDNHQIPRKILSKIAKTFHKQNLAQEVADHAAALPMSAQWWKRVLLGNAMDVEMDGTGRVLISPELRAAAGISKDTMLLGMGNHFELWDKATYETLEAQAMQGEMPDVFKEFSF